MLTKDLSDKILIIGTDLSGKGGIALLIKSYTRFFPTFNYICTHQFTNKFRQILIALKAIILTIYYCLFKNIKIIHIHTASYNSFFRDSIYFLIAKKLKKTVILHLHGGKFETFYNKHPKYCSYICGKADCIIAVSNYFGNIFKKLNLNKNIQVIYNSADEILNSRISKETKREQLNITFLGAIEKNKGIFDIIECLNRNYTYFKTKKTHIHICGVGNSKELTNMIEKYNLLNLITYHGWVNKENKNLLLANTDIYLQPSYFESLGIAIIEAMNYSIPIIASDTGGIPELVEHNNNGLLIEPGNINELFNALKKLIEDSELRTSMGKKAYIKSHLFTTEIMECKLNNLYNYLLN